MPVGCNWKEPRLFTQFGKYKIQGKLGRGGMGDVYLAFDEERKRRVALKLVEATSEPESRLAVAAEEMGAELQERLCRHTRHVPEVHEYGLRDGHFYIVMEYVEGKDLDDLIIRRSLSSEDAIRYAAQVCLTLEVGHSLPAFIKSMSREIKGVVHGDIKPKNIRIDAKGQVRLLDFGIAKALSLTRNLTHSDFGSLDYCSPERIDSGRLDIHSDLWSVGVLLYEMVSGYKPFKAPSVRELEQKICSGAPPNPLPAACPKGLGAVITKALSHDIRDRYKSAAELRADLESLREEETLPVKGGQGLPRHSADRGVRKPSDKAHKKGKSSPSAKAGWGAWRITLLVLAVLLVAAAVPAYSEFSVWNRTRQLKSAVAAADVKRAADLDGYLQEYRELSQSNRPSYGVGEVGKLLSQKLERVADRVIADYANPTLNEQDWAEAKECLARVVQLDPENVSVKAKKYYCDGHLSFLSGTDEMKKASPPRMTPAAAAKFKEAIAHFENAVSARADWADPHLRLALIYTYFNFDFKRATEELDAAKRMGLNLAERETAIHADGLRIHGKRLYDRALNQSARDPAKFREARGRLRQALDNYRKIPTFGDSRRYITEIEEDLSDIDEILLGLEDAP